MENHKEGFNVVLNNDPRDVLKFCQMMVEQAIARGDKFTTEVAQDITTIVDVFVKSVADRFEEVEGSAPKVVPMAFNMGKKKPS